MKVKIIGKNIEITEALKDIVEKKISNLISILVPM